MTASACSYCDRPRPKNGDDPCIERLPGVLFACCGHGGGQAFTGSEPWSVPYVTEAGRTIYGHDAVKRMRELGGNPPDWDTTKYLRMDFGDYGSFAALRTVGSLTLPDPRRK